MDRGNRRLLLAGVGAVAMLPTTAFADQLGEGPSGGNPGDIVVYGAAPGAIGGLIPDDELTEADVAAYGQDTVGDLLDAVGSDINRNGEATTVLINGLPAGGINDVADLPTEAVSRIQILPLAAAARLGQPSTGRVVNVVLKQRLRQLTVNGKATLTTRGDAFQGEAEVNFLKLDGTNRRSLVLRALHSDPLLESERGIAADAFGLPFDRVGNVVSVGGSGGEIDPGLSALAGVLVTVAGVPSGRDRPMLPEFASLAGRPNAGGAQEARTLIGESSLYSVNGNITQRFSKQTALMINAKVDRSQNTALLGLSSALLRLPAGSPFSPFAGDVSLAMLLGDPLRSRLGSTGVDLAVALNTRLKTFTISARGSFVHRSTDVRTDRGYDLTSLEAGLLSGAVNPFAGIFASQLGPLRTDLSHSRSDNAAVQVVASGPLFKVPAGVTQLTITSKARFDRFSSDTQGIVSSSRSFMRDEAGIQGNLMIPLLPVPALDLGRLSLDLNAAVRQVSGAGMLHDYGAGLNWQLGPALVLTAAYSREEISPPAYALTDPIIVTENYRAFDFVQGRTVLVRLIAGGNPSLPVQTRRTTTIAGTLRPFATHDLNLTIQFTRIDSRNVFAPLPPVSAAIQAAFPDRFVRDAGGTLLQVDARPVTFLRDDSSQIRWGISFRRTFGGGFAGGEDEASPTPLAKGRGVRINLDVGDNWNLSSIRQARASLPVIDLLGGGAVGYGGGLTGHQLTFNAGIASRGMGLQVDGTWRSSSYLTTGTTTTSGRITFDGRLIVNARVFANLGPLLANTRWARGLRLSLQVNNLFDSRQYVTDETGSTPKRYQAFLLDPAGRSLTCGIRKAF